MSKIHKRIKAKRYLAVFLAATVCMTMPGMDALKVSAEPERTQEETDLPALAEKIHALYAGADLKKDSETEFGSGNLIVSATREDFDLLGAEERISLGNGIYVLSYPDSKSAKKACESYQKMEDIAFAEGDVIVKTQTEEAESKEQDAESKEEKRTKEDEKTEKEEKSKENETEKKTEEVEENQKETAASVPEEAAGNKAEESASQKSGTEQDFGNDVEVVEDVPEEIEEDGIIRVMLLDTGVKADTGNLAFYLQDTGINASGSGEEGNTADDNGHGSAMAQVIISALEKNGKSSDSVKILPVKVLDSQGYGTVLTTYLGMKAAMEQGADIICLGLSGKGESKLLEQTIKEAAGQGILVTAPAGNDGSDVSEYIPGRYNDLLVISSAESQDKPSTETNHGATVDFGAYGLYQVTGLKGTEQEMKGTSMACAYVTGVAASIEKGTPGQSVEAELVKQALPVTKPELIPYFGRGLIGEVPESEEEPEEGLEKEAAITQENREEEKEEAEDKEEIKDKDFGISEKSLQKKGSKGQDITIEKDEKGDAAGNLGDALINTFAKEGDLSYTLSDTTTVNGTITISSGTKSLYLNGKILRHGAVVNQGDKVKNAMIIIQPGATLNIYGGGTIKGRNTYTTHVQPLIVNRGNLNVGSVTFENVANNGIQAGLSLDSIDGATSLLYNRGTANLSGCSVTGCSSDYGFTMYNSFGTMNLVGCSIGGNKGGIGNGSVMHVNGCNIFGNTVSNKADDGSACRIGGLANSAGATMYIYGSTSIYQNASYIQMGGGIYNGGTIYTGHNGSSEVSTGLSIWGNASYDSGWGTCNNGGGLNNAGTLYNYSQSTIAITGNSIGALRNVGTVSNSGAIHTYSTTGNGIRNAGTFYNYGILFPYSNSQAGISNINYMYNSGSIYAYSNSGGGIRNSQTFINNDGTVESYGNVDGGVVNTSEFYNRGCLKTYSNSGGGVRNNDFFDSSGTLYSYGNYDYTDGYGNLERGVGLTNRSGATMQLNGYTKIGYAGYLSPDNFALSSNTGNAIKNAGELICGGDVRIGAGCVDSHAIHNTGKYYMSNTYVTCFGNRVGAGVYNEGYIYAVSSGIYGTAVHGLYNVSYNNNQWSGEINGNIQNGIYNTGDINMENGTIQNTGTGVSNSGIFSMGSGTIQNTGTGLYNTGTFYMSGGVIQNSKTHGVEQNGTFYMSGSAVVKKQKNNTVNLPTGRYITVDGVLTTDGIVAHVVSTEENLGRIIAKITYSGGKASDALFCSSGYRFSFQDSKDKERLLRPGDYMDREVLNKEGHSEITGKDIVISESYDVLYEKNIEEKDVNDNPVNVEVAGMPKTQSKYWCENLKMPNGTDSYQAPTVTTYPYSTYYELERWNDKADGNGTDYPMVYTYKENKGTKLYAIWRKNFKVAYIGNDQTKGEDFIDEGEDKKGYSEKLDYTFNNNEEIEKKKPEDYFQRLDTIEAYTDEETGEVVEQEIEGTVVGWAMKSTNAKKLDSYGLGEISYGEKIIEDATKDNNITYDAPNSDFGKFKENNIVAQVQNSVGINKTSSVLAVGVQKTQNISGGRYVNMYAVWDMGPIIEAYDRYYTLEEAQSGFISEEELLNAATATDEEVKSKTNEDGRLKNFVDEEKHTKFTVMDYQEDEFKKLQHSAIISVIYRAEDEAGNVTKKRILVHVVDGHDTVADGYDLGKEADAGKVRFISKKYLDTLDGNSVWVRNDDYVAALADAVSYERSNPEQSDPVPLLGDGYAMDIPGTGDWNKTPQSVWTFTREQVKEAQQFVEDYGPSNYENEDGLQKFYEKFSGCRQ